MIYFNFSAPLMKLRLFEDEPGKVKRLTPNVEKAEKKRTKCGRASKRQGYENILEAKSLNKKDKDKKDKDKKDKV